MNDGTKAKLLIAGRLTSKASPWVIPVCVVILVVAISGLLRESADRYGASMDALKELAEAGAVHPEIVGAFEGLAGLAASLFLLVMALMILMRRRRRWMRMTCPITPTSWIS